MARKVRSPILEDEPKRTVTEAEFDSMKEKLRHAPGPTPWYWADLPAMTRSDGTELTWRDTGREGMVVLGEDGSKGPIFIALGFYCYVWKLDMKTLLIFHERHVSEEYLSAHFHIVDVSSLVALRLEANAWSLERRRTHAKCPVAIDGGEQVVELPSDLEPGVHRLRLPEQMRRVEEYLLLMTKTGYRLRMYVVRPRRDEVEVVPLDWFTDGDFDHGYEWITRIARDPGDGNIIGEGIRILPFVMKPDGEFIEWIGPPQKG